MPSIASIALTCPAIDPRRSAPFLGGGFGHFYSYAPVHIQYAIDRYATEAKRQLDVLDKHLADKPFICGHEYTIADMAIFPWILCLSRGYKADAFLALHEYAAVRRWSDALLARPAVQRGLRVGAAGDNAVRERHSADDFLPKQGQ